MLGRSGGVGAGVAASFRTPYLAARVVEDTNPLPDVEIERVNVREPSLD